jgi:hypothetical protein
MLKLKNCLSCGRWVITNKERGVYYALECTCGVAPSAYFPIKPKTIPHPKEPMPTFTTGAQPANVDYTSTITTTVHEEAVGPFNTTTDYVEEVPHPTGGYIPNWFTEDDIEEL